MSNDIELPQFMSEIRELKTNIIFYDNWNYKMKNEK